MECGNSAMIDATLFQIELNLTEKGEKKLMKVH